MDLDSLKNQVSNISLYNIKAGFRKVENALMNFTELQTKVREATNNEPWGSSTSLMQEIADGTFNYSALNEIMPIIYGRFTRKAAEEWRQIYKSLQLLEFLIKNGSERVVDDARSRMSVLKMLRQFHFIDENGKDQGINVRNRAKELAELLGDVERIRSERKKARATRNKYGGVEGGVGIGGSSSARYGGFSNESAPAAGTYGGYSGGVYGDGGGFGGATDDYSESQSRRTRFEEYDEYDEGTGATPSRRKADASKRVTSRPEPPKAIEPEVDLFDFSADTIASSGTVSDGNQASGADGFGLLQSAGGGDDDFDDFQSAAPPPTISPPASTATTTTYTQFAAPQPYAPQSHSANMDFLSSTMSPPLSSGTPSGSNYSAFNAPAQTLQSPNYMQPQQQQAAPKPTGFQAKGPNYFGSIQTEGPTTKATTPGIGGVATSSTSKPAAKSSSGSSSDPFAGLAMGSSKKMSAAPTKGPTMADMARQKASAGIWGTSAITSQQQQQQPQSGGGSGSGNDLLGM